MKKSKNFQDGKFKNLVDTGMMTSAEGGMWRVFYEQFTSKVRIPKKPLKTKVFDKKAFMKLDNGFSWFGHSSLLFRFDGLTIVCDPVFGRSSPVSFMGPKPFPMTNAPVFEDLPDTIDIMLITHDHFDHLEKKTMQMVHTRVKKFYVPLKVKQILVKWGVPARKIVEFDWYDCKSYENIEIRFTPSRHFSGRGLTNRDETLWGGWILSSKSKNIYVSGDSGYFEEFKKIGKQYGPFDIAFVECGQYDKTWADIHMMPKEVVQAGIDSKASIIMPVHWGKYSLSVHAWKEPVQLFVKEAKKKKQTVNTPMIGEVCTFESVQSRAWWK